MELEPTASFLTQSLSVKLNGQVFIHKIRSYGLLSPSRLLKVSEILPAPSNTCFGVQAALD